MATATTVTIWRCGANSPTRVLLIDRTHKKRTPTAPTNCDHQQITVLEPKSAASIGLLMLVCMNVSAAMTARLSSTSKYGSRVLHSIGARSSSQRSSRRIKARSDTYTFLMRAIIPFFLGRSVLLKQARRLAPDVATMRELHIGIL